MRERRRGLPLLAEQSALVLILGSAVVSGTAEKTRTAYLVGIVLLSVALVLHVFLFVYTLRRSAPPLLRNLHVAALILLVAALATTVADLPIALTIPLKCAAAVAATGVLLVASAPLPSQPSFMWVRDHRGWQRVLMPAGHVRGYDGQMPWNFPRKFESGVMMPPGPAYFRTRQVRAEWRFREPAQGASDKTAIAYTSSPVTREAEAQRVGRNRELRHLPTQLSMTKTLVLLGLMTAEEGDNALRWFDEYIDTADHGNKPYITKNTVLDWFNHKAYPNDPDYVWHRTALRDVDEYKSWVFDLKNNLQVGDRALAVYELEDITDGNVHVERFKIIRREQNGLRIYDFNVDSAQIIPDNVADVSLRAAFEQLQKNGIVAIYTLGK